jgi:hypothetical protein
VLDAANYRAIEKLRDGRSYIIRANVATTILLTPFTCGLPENLLLAVPHPENIV